MSLTVKSVDRQQVLDLAAVSVDGAARDGGMIAADMEAHRLLDAHPGCQIPFKELRDSVARLAIDHGVGVEFGVRSYQQQHAISSRPRNVVAATKVCRRREPERRKRPGHQQASRRSEPMTVSPLDTEHMSSLAGELAKSGDYLGWTEIEMELRDRNYADAPEWLRDTKLRKRLDEICRAARLSQLVQPLSRL